MLTDCILFYYNNTLSHPTTNHDHHAEHLTLGNTSFNWTGSISNYVTRNIDIAELAS